MRKIIEFVHQPIESKVYSPMIICLDVNDISIFEQINKQFCKLTTKNKEVYYVYGSYRVIGNRVSHTHLKTHKIYEDIIIRPSTALVYKMNLLEVSNILMDAGQLKAFIDAFYFQENLEEHYNELINHTYDSIMEVPSDFWKINHN